MSQMIQFDRVTVCAVVIQSLLQRSCVLLIPALAALTWLSLSPAARAVSPPPDGGYPGFNTAEGDDALFSLTTGTQNTATGTKALFANTTGGSNTANGLDALLSNTIGSNNTASGLSALDNNDSGNNNTASGAYALFHNVAG